MHQKPYLLDAAKMSVEKLLSTLDKVIPTGPGRWLARCPAHPDKSPSLSIRLRDDGRVLVHCFSGCEVQEVLNSVGMTFEDLFPPKEAGHHGRERAPFPALDILRALQSETLTVIIGLSKVTRGEALNEIDSARMRQALDRISQTYSLVEKHG